MNRWPTTAHSPRRWIWASMASARSEPSSARALSRPARRPARLATTAVPTVAHNVTNVPRIGPNRNPLPAARTGPGTKIAPSAADNPA